MAVPEQIPYTEFVANGVTKVFPLGFVCKEQNHLLVLVDDSESTVGNWQLDEKNKDIVFQRPPAKGSILKFQRKTPFQRERNYQSYNNSFRPDPVNNDFDDIWLKLQEMGVLNWQAENNIKSLNQYIDALNKETREKFLRDIQAQGISLSQLDVYMSDLNKKLAATSTEKGWFSEFIADGKENQKEINDKTTRFCATIEDLIKIKVRRNQQEVSVTSDLRGGVFYFDSTRVAENNGGTCFNGWVRKYFGSVYLDWFCEKDPAKNDCSVAMEKALAITRGVKASGREYLFTGRVGIPDFEQTNYAWRKIRIHGDGDTTFRIDCKSHGRATFTSARAKLNPTLEEDIFVAKINFKDIDFIGVNTNFGFALTEENKNQVDIVFDGDRLYNTYVQDCNFVHLKNALKCEQGRGNKLEKGNAYSQSFSFTNNHFYHNTCIVEANQLINFRFIFNKCEANYAGFKLKTLNIDVPAMAVVTIDYNLFEGGGQFIDVVGNALATSVWNNYLEHNIYDGMLKERCQMLWSGYFMGGVIGANSFSGQFGFVGYDTDYVDIKVEGKEFSQENTILATDYSKTKPVLIGNYSNTRQLISSGRGLDIGNSSPFMYENNYVKRPTKSHINSANLRSAQESDTTFNRGTFEQIFDYSDKAPNGQIISVNTSTSILIGIVDGRSLEADFKNRISTLNYEFNFNTDLLNKDKVVIANASIKVAIGVFGTGKGLSNTNQYSSLRVAGKLLCILQPYDIPLTPIDPSSHMRKQWDDTKAFITVEPYGDGRFGIRLHGFKSQAVGSFGEPKSIYSDISITGHVGHRGGQEFLGSRVGMINYWW